MISHFLSSSHYKKLQIFPSRLSCLDFTGSFLLISVLFYKRDINHYVNLIEGNNQPQRRKGSEVYHQLINLCSKII